MRKLLLIGCAVAVVTISSRAQDKDETFEVASVRANKSGDGNGMLRQLPGGRMTATNMPLRPMITFAYSLAGYQLIGGPGWLNTNRYDVNAKMDAAPSSTAFLPGSTAPNPMQLALQKLLEDRFKLKIHRETREMDIYALVLLKPGAPGPGLKPSTTDCAAAAAAAQRGAPPPAPGSNAPFCGIQGGNGRLRFGGLPAAAFGSALSGPAGRFVADRTGLSGSWDFELTFAPEQRGQAPGGNAANDSDVPGFFTAIQEQLGLKLEPTKGPVDVVVIDSIEQPKDD